MLETLYMEQNTPEWHEARLGIITASSAACLLVKGKSASGLGAGAFTYMNELIGERFTGEPAAGWGGNEHTERGHEQEPEAREMYLANTGTKESDTDKVGIYLNHGCGYSPDLAIGKNGLLEVKTKMAKFQVAILEAFNMPKEHMPQVQFGLWVSEREWCDFISYCRGMPPFVFRIYRDKKMINDIAERVRIFYDVMEHRMTAIQNNSM